jgi:lipopolysaccharide transport system permease protein
MFASPVAYPSSLVPRWLYGINPMAGAIDGFRLGYHRLRPGPSFLLLASRAVVVLGGLFFNRLETSVADRVKFCSGLLPLQGTGSPCSFNFTR